MAKEFKLTRERLKELEAELNYLKTTKEKEVAEQIKEARSFGDLSENSEYDEAKNEQAIVESRIATLEATLKNAVIVEDEAEVKIDEDRIRLGNTIRVLDLETGEEQVYDIVSSIEADPMNGKISDDSPLGSAVLGQQSGQTIEVEAPIGTLKYKILGIEK